MAARMTAKQQAWVDYHSKRWRALSAKAMRRDGYKCQIAARYGRNEPAEIVHHIYPADEYPEYAWCMWNLISLSRAAHNRLHDRENNTLTPEGVALMRKTAPPTDHHNPMAGFNGVG